MMILEIPQQNLNVKLINDHCSPRLKYNSNVYLKSYYNKSTTLLYKHFFSIYSSSFLFFLLLSGPSDHRELKDPLLQPSHAYL